MTFWRWMSAGPEGGTADAEDLTEDVRSAYVELIRAFGAHDTVGYFDAFAENATFTFYNSPQVFSSKAEYMAAWTAWEEDGFRVLSCHTSDVDIALVGDELAVLTHVAVTRLAGLTDELRERETIVFRRVSRRWLAIHEHLSPEPTAAARHFYRDANSSLP